MRVVAVMTVEPPPALDATEAPDRIDLASHLPEIPTFSAGPLGTGSVEFSALSLRGLDHFENTSAALVDARSVRVAARLPSLKAHAALKLTLTPIPAEEPSEGCNGCAWIAEHKCPFDYESDAQNEATDDGTDHVMLQNFTDPSFTLSATAGAQEIAVYVKKVVDATQSDPTLTISIYDGTNCADLHETGASPSTISSGTGELVTQTWTASGISSAADVCVQLSCARSGGSPANRRSCSFDAIEWRAVE